MILKTSFYVYKNVFLVTAKYPIDNSFYLSVMSREEGPIVTITKCLDNKELGDYENYVDVNNCPWAPDFLVDNNLAQPTGEFRNSGYCIYPVYKFNIDEIKKYLDPWYSE